MRLNIINAENFYDFKNLIKFKIKNFTDVNTLYRRFIGRHIVLYYKYLLSYNRLPILGYVIYREYLQNKYIHYKIIGISKYIDIDSYKNVKELDLNKLKAYVKFLIKISKKLKPWEEEHFRSKRISNKYNKKYTKIITSYDFDNALNLKIEVCTKGKYRGVLNYTLSYHSNNNNIGSVDIILKRDKYNKNKYIISHALVDIMHRIDEEKHIYDHFKYTIYGEDNIANKLEQWIYNDDMKYR